jgi:hypothetical protein
MKVIRTLDEYLEAINPFQQKVLAQIHRYGSRRPSILYRGQKDVELVSKIGRIVKDKKIESPITFERNCLRLIRSCLGGMTRYSDWDLIALSQHYGIETRFLDWSSNSLVALWFAVNSRKEIIPKETPVVWILETIDMDFEIPEHERSPIPDQKGAQTVIFTPDLIDSRMYTQDSYLMRQI